MDFIEKIRESQDRFAETGAGLQNIIDAYRRSAFTRVLYSDGAHEEFLIEGELKSRSIPDKQYAVRLEIGTAVTSVGDYALWSGPMLSSLTIPNSVVSIGTCGFRGCDRLTSVAIPNSVTRIGGGAFKECSGLISMTVPDSVTYIEDSLFERCTSLTSVTIGSRVEKIGQWAFSECQALRLIESPCMMAPNIPINNTFGNSEEKYTGRNTFSTGDNVLKIPQGATGYDTGAWADPLQDSSKCGFHIEYLN